MTDRSIKILIKAYQDIYSINELSKVCGCTRIKIRELWEQVYEEQREYNLTQEWVEDKLIRELKEHNSKRDS